MKLSKFLGINLIIACLFTTGCNNATATSAILNKPNLATPIETPAPTPELEKETVQILDDSNTTFSVGYADNATNKAMLTTYFADKNDTNSTEATDLGYIPIASYNDIQYYIKQDEDQIHVTIYNSTKGSNEFTPLTQKLRSVSKIIPTKNKLFFLGNDTDNGTNRLGVLNLETTGMAFWGDLGCDVGALAVNPTTEKVYFVTRDLFIGSDHIPNYELYETSFNFDQDNKILSSSDRIDYLAVNPNDNNLLIVREPFEGEQNGLYIRTNSFEGIDFTLPPQRIELGGCVFSNDGRGLYSVATVDNIPGVYFYNFDTKEYNLIVDLTGKEINIMQPAL